MTKTNPVLPALAALTALLVSGVGLGWLLGGATRPAP